LKVWITTAKPREEIRSDMIVLNKNMGNFEKGRKKGGDGSVRKVQRKKEERKLRERGCFRRGELSPNVRLRDKKRSCHEFKKNME